MAPLRMKHPFNRASEKLKDAMISVKSKGLYTKLKIRTRDRLQESKQWFSTYKIRIAGGLGALVIIAGIGYAGDAYVQANMNEVYEVYVDGQLIGSVSSPEVVETLIADKLEQVSNEHPEVQWEIERDSVTVEKELVFKGEGEDEQTVAALEPMLEAKAVGVELIVDGEAVAIVRDQETANRILEKVKETFSKKSAPEGLMVLSAEPVEPRDDNVIAEGTPEIQSVRIVEPINMTEREIDPSDVMDELDVIEKLMTGDVEPTQYIVQKGDTPSQIAEKLNVPIEVLYSQNQDHKDLIERDIIRPGDVLDVTMLQPAVTVETVEQVTETITVNFETIYENDDSMRKGKTKTIREGADGVKKVTYSLKKVNGLLMEEKIIGEEILKESVPAIVKRGTKVVLGEGTGKFAWPVASPEISSSYGKRWGRQHKGIDIVSSKKSILAADTGKVIFAGEKGDYGNAVIIDHQNGYQTLYGHMSKIDVKKGDIVEKGDKIGTMGSTGRSTGTHLHFEVIVNGTVKNPMSYLR